MNNPLCVVQDPIWIHWLGAGCCLWQLFCKGAGRWIHVRACVLPVSHELAGFGWVSLGLEQNCACHIVVVEAGNTCKHKDPTTQYPGSCVLGPDARGIGNEVFGEGIEGDRFQVSGPTFMRRSQ